MDNIVKVYNLYFVLDVKIEWVKKYEQFHIWLNEEIVLWFL